jgi:hypothetical protein
MLSDERSQCPKSLRVINYRTWQEGRLVLRVFLSEETELATLPTAECWLKRSIRECSKVIETCGKGLFKP